MTTTNVFSGIGEGQRISSRVLKPPGGGCSISFGGDDEPVRPTKSANPSATAPQDNSQSNGTVQNGNHTNGQTPTTNGTCNGTTSNGSMTPNGCSTTASSPGSAKSVDTQNRLFGGTGHPNGSGSNNSSTPNGRDTPSKPKVRDHMRSSIFGDNSNPSSRNGTPNGTGTPSGCDTTAKATPEPPKPASAPAAQPAQPKTRVPPGGFSTALW